MSDDLYDLIGVEPDASTEQIREKYRARRDELADADTADAKAESAALNRAWNVLSDPYQRGRYDAQREAEPEAIDGNDVEIVDEPDASLAPRKKRRLFEPPPPAAGAKATVTPTVELPSGVTLAETRPRLTAMFIDLLVLLALFALFQGVTGRLERHFYPDESHAVTVANRAVTAADKEATAANKALSAAKKSGDATAIAAAQKRADLASDHQKTANKHLATAERKLTPFSLTWTVLFFLIGLAFLVIPTARSGQTLGKRIQHVRAVNQDGSPLGWSGAMRRFGPIIGVTLLLYVACLGPYAALIVVIGLVGWTRNANRQGMHDRLAKTVVVDA